jgi:mono/diheme cytochrome c family protein
VINEASRNLSVLDLAVQGTTSAVAATAMPTAGSSEEKVNSGRRAFHTGLGRWSLRGQAWSSCGACHPDGLSDGVTWFFARGPRQTIALDGTYDPQDGQRRRILNWTAIFDETHDFETNTRGVSGGVGAIVHQVSAPPVIDDRVVFDGAAPIGGQVATATPQDGLNGSTASMMPGGPTTPGSKLSDFNDLDEYVKEIRAPRGATGLNAAQVAAGRSLFQNNGCAGCHGGSQWTISRVFYTPNQTNNHPTTGALRSVKYTRPSGFPAVLNPPSASTGDALLRYDGIDDADDAANDQINCVLRNVGTFASGGVAPSGVTVKEVRANMTTTSQGASGYNMPSLLGLVTGAPYFHAGNARTLEEALGSVFAAHRRAFSVNFDPGPMAVNDLTMFLISIDESTTAFLPGPSHDLCAQIPPGSIN